jgi:hypothetical protein
MSVRWKKEGKVAAETQTYFEMTASVSKRSHIPPNPKSRVTRLASGIGKKPSVGESIRLDPWGESSFAYRCW